MDMPGLGVSVLLFRDETAAEVLLVQRGKEPAMGLWAPPGGRVELGETIAAAAAREVLEETGLVVSVPADASFSTVDVIERSPNGEVRFHFLLVAVLALFDGSAEPLAADDAADCRWWPVDHLDEAQPQVAELTHVVELARKRLGELAGR